jgi:short-subunit dehydrogenase
MWSYRRALVTGASSGIGEQIARELAARGTDLVLVARRTDRLDALAADLAGRNVEVLTADLCDPAQLASVEARLADTARPVDLLINNAGTGISGDLTALRIDEVDTQIQLNFRAPLRLTRAALPGMVERRSGGVLLVASLAGFQPVPGSATYAATKAGLITFGESLAAEVRRHGVRVTVLCPGFTRTENPDADEPGGIPAFMWLSRQRVATAALDALGDGRVICVPGMQYKVLATVPRLLPRRLVRGLADRVRAV